MKDNGVNPVFFKNKGCIFDLWQKPKGQPIKAALHERGCDHRLSFPPKASF